MNDQIAAIFFKHGITEVGFCGFDTVRDHLLDCRAKKRIPEGAKSILLCLFPYKVKEQKPKNISRYAAVPDYHGVCGAKLSEVAKALQKNFPSAQFAWFIDNSPIPEVAAAVCAGLGVRGENGLLIHPRYGSWCFIGEIVTDLPLDCQNDPKPCLQCGLCKKTCPKQLDKTRCLSAVTQKKGDLTEQEAADLRRHGLLWGCDLCSENCPMNKKAEKTDIPAFISGYRDEYILGENIENRAYAWRGEAPVRRNAELQKK